MYVYLTRETYVYFVIVDITAGCMGLVEGSRQTLRTAIIFHFGAFLYFHRALDGKFVYKHVKVSDLGDTNISSNIPVT